MQTSKDPIKPITMSWQLLKHTWVSLCGTCTGFSPNPSRGMLKALLPQLSPTSLARHAHRKLNGAAASFFGADYNFLTIKEIVAIKEVIVVITVPETSFILLHFPAISPLNPLKTCAGLWVCILMVYHFPAPWHGHQHYHVHCGQHQCPALCYALSLSPDFVSG